jgi:hypothetical protein
MFRRRTSSSGKIHYRINIDKIITRSDFVGNFGLGFVSLSYELNESTQAFHITRTHPNVFARSSSCVLFGYIRYLYERFIRLIINSFNISNIQIIL